MSWLMDGFSHAEPDPERLAKFEGRVQAAMRIAVVPRSAQRQALLRPHWGKVLGDVPEREDGPPEEDRPPLRRRRNRRRRE